MPVEYLEISTHIAWITLNRPRVLNALDLGAAEAFAAAVERAHANMDLRVLLLTGAGERAFCSGGDLSEHAGLETESDGRRISAGMTAALARLESLPIPTIAVINGLTRGGGAEIALACDMRLISAAATIGFTQIQLALTPGWGGGQRLLRLVGYARALEILLEGRILDAEEALGLGLVNGVLSQGRLLPESAAWAQRLAARPPEAVRAVKRILGGGVRLPPDQAETEEASVFPPLWAGPDHHRLVEAFLNRSRE